MEIGEKIKKIRTENGLSQEQFAEIFHVTRQAVSNWENGKNYPDMSTLSDISSHFDVPLDELIKQDEAFIEDIDKTVASAGRRKKWLMAAGIVLAAVLLCLAVPRIVKQIYYDPEEIVCSDEWTDQYGDTWPVEEKRLGMDMLIYSYLNLPGEALWQFDSTDRGMGRYDVMLQHEGLGWKLRGDTFMSVQIKRNQMQIYDPGDFLTLDSPRFAWHAAGPDAHSLKEEAKNNTDLSSYENLTCSDIEMVGNGDENSYYEIYVTFDKIMDYPDTLKWLDKHEVGSYSASPWAAVVTDDEWQAHPIGFYVVPMDQGTPFDKEKYPYLLGYEDFQTTKGERLDDEETAKQHLISMLDYIKDQKTFRDMMTTTNCLDFAVAFEDYAEEYIEYIEANGIHTYGVALAANRDTILGIYEDPAVFSITVRSE